MHVLCPSCTTVYEIPALQRPRKLRCARCATEWRVMPEEDAPPAEPAPVADPDEAVAQAGAHATAEGPEPIALASLTGLDGRIGVPAVAARRQVPWSVLWVVSLFAIAAWMMALWHWRGAIGHAWPPSLRLYRLLPGGAAAGMA